MSAFTDQSSMPFGKYKGTPMGEVPDEYFQWLCGEGWVKTDLLNYAQDRVKRGGAEVPQQSAPEGRSTVPPERISQCRSCNADIIWIKFNGKNHPVDAQPKRGFTSVEDEYGNHVCWEPDALHESHFATCPDADQHRGQGRSQDSAEPEPEPDPPPPDMTTDSPDDDNLPF